MGCSQSHGTGGSKSGEHALHCSDRTTCEVPSEHLHTSHAGVPEGALFPMADDSLFDTVVTAKGEDRFVWQLRLSEAALRRKMEACSPSFIMRGRAWRMLAVSKSQEVTLCLQLVSPCEDDAELTYTLTPILSKSRKQKRQAGGTEILHHSFTREFPTWGVAYPLAGADARAFDAVELVVVHAEFGPSSPSAGTNKCPHAATPSPPRRSLSAQHHHRRSAFADGLHPASEEASISGGAMIEGDSVSELVSRPPMSLQLLSMDPLLCIVDGFLSPEECNAVCDLSTPELRRSRVTDGHVSSGRISQSTFLTGDRSQHPLVKKIEARIAELFASAECVALNTKYNGGQFTPLVGAEPIQVVKYEPGNFYTAHFDNRSGSLARSLTFMVYLNDVAEGGCTFFPKAVPYDGAPAESGIRIHPRMGRCVLFWNVKERGRSENDNALHAAEVVAAGHKWIMTKWFKVDPAAAADQQQQQQQPAACSTCNVNNSSSSGSLGSSSSSHMLSRPTAVTPSR